MEKIINETTVEKVLTLGATHQEKAKRSKGTTLMMIVCVSVGIGSIVFLPWKHAIVALLFAVAVCAVCFTVYIKATSSATQDPDKASVIRTGDTFSYRYEFDETGFTVSGNADKTVRWEDVISIRNIGNAYQIKCGEDHFTVKKQGFTGGSDKAFKALLESKGITVK